MLIFVLVDTKHRNTIPKSGALTTSMNVENREFKEMQVFLKHKADSLSEKEKIQIELFALQIRVEDYLNAQTEEEREIVTVGEWLRLYIDTLNLKQNKLAKYIGLNPSNFNKILSGHRKINFEMSFVLSQIFGLDPKIWILIQVKNEYIALKKNKSAYFQQFKLEDLII